MENTRIVSPFCINIVETVKIYVIKCFVLGQQNNVEGKRRRRTVVVVLVMVVTSTGGEEMISR